MPFQILMVFHFLESRKRRIGADFSGVEILSDLNPGPGSGGSRPKPAPKGFTVWQSQRSRNNGAAARKTQASRRAPARPRFLEPFTKPLGWGLTPRSQAVARPRQDSGPQVEQETALGQTSSDHLVQPQVREMALAKLPRRRGNFVRRPWRAALAEASPSR